MAATKSALDSRPNLAAIKITEAVAGTLAYAKFAFPFSIMDKMGILIHRLEYWVDSLSLLSSATATLFMGLAQASAIVNIQNQDDPAIVDSVSFQRLDYGVAGSAEIVQNPYVKDFSSLPGDGILVAPSPLTGMILSSGAAGVTHGWLRMYYTYMQLSTEDYWQLVESRRVISS